MPSIYPSHQWGRAALRLSVFVPLRSTTDPSARSDVQKACKCKRQTAIATHEILAPVTRPKDEMITQEACTVYPWLMHFYQHYFWPARSLPSSEGPHTLYGVAERSVNHPQAHHAASISLRMASLTILPHSFACGLVCTANALATSLP